MEHGACNIIYLDRRAQEELVRKDSVMSGQTGSDEKTEVKPECHKSDLYQQQQAQEISSNITSILSTFTEGEFPVLRLDIQLATN
jgi:hypothetical protein